MAEVPVDVFLAVGSNIHPETHILAALTRIKRVVRVTGVSTFYRTQPLDDRARLCDSNPNPEHQRVAPPPPLPRGDLGGCCLGGIEGGVDQSLARRQPPPLQRGDSGGSGRIAGAPAPDRRCTIVHADVGRPDQPQFLNGVWRIETSLTARELKFDTLRSIETELGRVRTQDKYAPRTIDLDIVLYGQAVIHEPGLIIPDPDIRTRAFIAVPVLELAPDLILPDSGERLASIAHFETAALLPAAEFTELLRRAAFDDDQ